MANLSGIQKPRQPLKVLKYKRGFASELLCRCKYFEVNRLIINTERCREMAEYKSDSQSFRILLCSNGCGSMVFDGEIINFFKGDCIFVPANSVDIKIHGHVQFLDIRG